MRSIAFGAAWVMPSGLNPGATASHATLGGVVSTGGGNYIGSLVVSPIGTPAAPTLSTNGTAGSTSYVYACTGFDINGNQTIPSATATITTGPASLTTTNSINVTCGGKSGAVGYLIHKVDTSHVLASCYANSGGFCTVIDNGSVATTFTYTPNTVDQTGSVSSGLVTTFNSALQENTAGTGINTLTTQNQTAFTVTGATANMGCECNSGAALPATWQTGIVLGCFMTANTLTPFLTNPTATATITPAANPINCRVLP